MATYAIQTDPDGSDWPDDPAMKFKYRHQSNAGARTAQAVFDQLRRDGKYVRMTRWERGEVVACEEGNPAK